MNTIPALPPGPTDAPPAKPHPIDVAVGALSEFAAELLASSKPNRFAELQVMMNVVQAVQRLKPPELAGVAGMGLGDHGDEAFGGFDGGGVGVHVQHALGVPIRGHNIGAARWNDAADMQTQLLMMLQTYFKQYMDNEKVKANRPDPDIRLNEVAELAELFGLRLKIAATEGEEVPPEITSRIDHLLKRIGEPPHEPARPEPGPDPVVPADHVRGHQVDGAGPDDGSRVGEPVAE